MKRGFLRNLAVVFSYLVYTPIVFVMYAIVWLDRKIKFPLPFPRDVAEFAAKPEWYLKKLKKNGILPGDAQLSELKVTPLNQDIIFRSNACVADLHYLTRGERKTLKCFAKFAPTMGTVWNRVIFNLQINHVKESVFNKYFVQVDKEVAAPAVYYSEVGFFTGNLCLITEHMTDCIEYRECDYENFPEEYMALALENIAALHARYWHDSSKRVKKVLPIPAVTVDMFDVFVRSTWSIPARKILVQSWHLMNEPETILHGDARIGNMMFPAGKERGRFVFIDWQAARRGKAMFDVAYFLVLSMIEDFRKANEEKALVLYHQYLVAKGVKDYSQEQMQEDYRHACLCLLVLLSLPLLSGEASVEGKAALLFVYGMNIWRERLKTKFDEFDYKWLSHNYAMTEQEGRDAVNEMLDVIEKRIGRIYVKNAYALPSQQN